MATHGHKKHNDVPPEDTNLGTLPAVANASAPVLGEGKQVGLSVDLLGNLRVGSPNDNLIWEVDNTSDSSAEYWGYAAPGSATSAAVWKIMKITKDSNGLMIRRRFANGSPSFTNVFDNRVSLSYS